MLPKSEAIDRFHPTRWYCYVHRNSLGISLYVGKGCGSRAFITDPASRGKLWMNIHWLCPDGYSVELCYTDSEVNAFILERQIIQEFRPILNYQGSVIALGTDRRCGR